MNIALITEGVSEYRVIKYFISKYLKNLDINTNQIQPQILNNKQQTAGGWNEVLKYCALDTLDSILTENEYLVVQIDTDQSETEPFNIKHSKNGSLKTNEELYSDVNLKLRSLIKPEILKKFQDKIIFAICIHTIECWLLPMYSLTNKSDNHRCILPLNRALLKKDMFSIPTSKNSSNGIKAYNELLSPIKKINILDASKFCFGLNKFITDLNKIELNASHTS